MAPFHMATFSAASCSTCIFLFIFTSASAFLELELTESLVGSTDLSTGSCKLQNKTKGIKATCSHLGLTSIPPQLPSNTITLDVSYNQIRALQNDSFEGLLELSSLSLKENHISDLEVGTFLPLKKLRSLDMTGNLLTHLQPNLFNSNQMLSNLMLFSNNFSSVPTTSLSRLPLLRNIFLGNNSIRVADFTAFSHSRTISQINFANNQISTIEASDFKPLQNHSLQSISLEDNDLHSLPARVFSHLNNINLLVLDRNALHDFNSSSFLGSMNIDSMSVRGCRIYNIVKLDNSSHDNASFPVIRSIDMSGNIIHYIPPYAFRGFNQTRTLNIQRNKITTMYEDSFCGLDSLINLDLSDNRIYSIIPGMFSCNTKLQELIISRNEIARLNIDSFRGLYALHTLNLSHNILKHIDDRQQWDNPALRNLNLSNNRFLTLHPRFFSGNLPNISVVDVSFNKISDYSPDTFNNIPSVKELYLIAEQNQYLPRVFSQMKNLITLDISHTRTEWTSLDQFTETSSLQDLRMCYNNLHHYDLFEENMTQSSLFEGLVSLKKLNLRGNDLNGLDPGVFTPLIKLYTLDLSLCHIAHLTPGVFQGLTSLKNLYLSENVIITTSAGIFKGLDYLTTLFFRNSRLQIIDKDLFARTPHLKHLYLSGNHISKVQKETFFPTNHTLRIDMSNNWFSCNCKLSWFINFLRDNDVVLIRPDQTKCYNTSFKAMIGKPITSFTPADFCRVDALLISGLSLLALTLIVSLVTAYNKRWWLNHKFFLLKLAIFGYEEMEEDFIANRHEFHLNLMYSEAEDEWVLQVMKPALEERLPHLQRVIYGDGDLPLGMFYIEAINDVIDNSFKTILLVSNQSIADPWFMTKLRLAFEHVNDTQIDKVILIFIEDIEDENLPYLVRLFLSRNKPYMQWTDDEDGQELFWAQFDKSMRANKAINNNIPL
ncbi:insulin-like growth factor-binding protein complex acid labile subunit [Lytechinus variegatus]|uniref:insulin-like growth factor-binding protein complex acid labile subunit n=1 Tax=Lytechinus variegatus TaxID=7654 RepID=UPI001BB16C20|nr:insulin-like growth factor-binding protein complex acid labile subunit [Lytechinus variegatus]